MNQQHGRKRNQEKSEIGARYKNKTGDVCEVVGKYERYKKGWNGLQVSPFL
jgi:hypothetical protein